MKFEARITRCGDPVGDAYRQSDIDYTRCASQNNAIAPVNSAATMRKGR